MPIRLGTNIASLNAQRQLNINSADFTKRVERLSSGLRINRGADDAAGLSVSEGMRSEILGMRQGVRNAEQGISMIQLAEGSLNEVSNMLRRMREISVQSANSTTVPTPPTAAPRPRSPRRRGRPSAVPSCRAHSPEPRPPPPGSCGRTCRSAC